MQALNLEIVVVSDEEDIETFLVAQQFLTPNDVFVKRAGPAGPAASRNVGGRCARGDYLLFLDDDDCFCPELIVLLRDFVRNDKKIIYWNYQIAVADKLNIFLNTHVVTELIGSTDVNLLYVRNFIPNNCVAIPRALMRERYFDVNLSSHEDWDFLLSFLAGGAEFSYAPFTGSVVYRHSIADQRNSSSLANGEWGPNFLYIYRKWRAPDSLKGMRRARLAEFGIQVPADWL